MQQQDARDMTKTSFPREDILWLQVMACGTMVQHVGGDTGYGASVVPGDHVRMDLLLCRLLTFAVKVPAQQHYYSRPKPLVPSLETSMPGSTLNLHSNYHLPKLFMSKDTMLMENVNDYIVFSFAGFEGMCIHLFKSTLLTNMTRLCCVLFLHFPPKKNYIYDLFLL